MIKRLDTLSAHVIMSAHSLKQGDNMERITENILNGFLVVVAVGMLLGFLA